MFNLLFRFYCLFSFFLFWLCPFLKNRIFGLVLTFDFFVFCSVVVRLESGLQKKNLSSFNLVSTWFGYRGVTFAQLVHSDGA